MKRFGRSVLFRYNLPFLSRVMFYLVGQDFIGAAIRFSHFKKVLDKIKFNNCLDAGCGTGDFSFYVAEKFDKSCIDAIDIVGSTLKKNEKIRKSMKIKNIKFFKKNLLKLRTKEKYEFIYLIGTLIYFTNEENVTILKNIKNALKPKGFFYMEIPQKNFDDINIIPKKYYKNEYKKTLEENKGYLYSFKDLNSLLNLMGFKIIDSHYTFGYVGKLAWEIDTVLKEHKLNKAKIMLLPILKIMAWFDAQMKNKKGCCISVLYQKR